MLLTNFNKRKKNKKKQKKQQPPRVIESRMSLDELLDAKELVSAKIDDIEIAMISARGAKMSRLAEELDELEAKKHDLKHQIKALERELARVEGENNKAKREESKEEGGKTPLQGAGMGPVATKVPLVKKGLKKNKAGGKQFLPPKQQPQQQQQRPLPLRIQPEQQQQQQQQGPKVTAALDATEEAELKKLEEEVLELEKRVEQKEDEENRLRFELKLRKTELLKMEALIHDAEQEVLKVAIQVDPSIRYVVSVQRRIRAKLLRRRWKNREGAALKPIVEAYLVHADAKPDRAKWNLLLEFFKSQRDYVDSLRVAVDKYLEPLRRTNSMVSGATREDIAALFGALDVITPLEVDIVTEVHKRIYSRFLPPTLGDVLMRWTSVFPLYVTQCKSLDVAFRTMGSLQKTSKLFPGYLEKLASNSQSAKPLTTLLEQPPQRLFQYETILSALLQLTPATHSDHLALRSTLKGLGEACQEVRTFQQDQKAMLQLATLKRRIQNLPDSVCERLHRKLLLELDVTMVEGSGRIRGKLFLFNDIVVVTAMGRSTLMYSETLEMRGLHYTSLPDTESVYNGWELQTIKRCLTFVSNSFEDKMRFEAKLQCALEDLKTNDVVDGFQQDQHDQHQGGFKMPALQRLGTGLQTARLQGEIAALSDQYSKLPAASREVLRGQRFDGIVEFLPEPGVLRSLSFNFDALMLAVRVLDHNKSLPTALKGVFRGLLQKFPDPVALTQALASTKESVASVSLTACAALLAAKHFLSICVGAHFADILTTQKLLVLDASRGALKEQEDALEAVASKLMGTIVKSANQIPSLFQEAVHFFKLRVRKSASDPKVADAATGALLFASLFGPAFRNPARFGFCSDAQQQSASDALESVMECLMRIFAQAPYPQSMGVAKLDKLILDSRDGVAKLVDACRERTVEPSQVNVQSNILPELLKVIVPEIERFSDTKFITAVARAVVLSK